MRRASKVVKGFVLEWWPTLLFTPIFVFALALILFRQ